MRSEDERANEESFVVADEGVEALSDDELEVELTVASHDPVRRARRYDRLVAEWTARRRGYRRTVVPAHPS
jgi:hypothetical protein